MQFIFMIHNNKLCTNKNISCVLYIVKFTDLNKKFENESSSAIYRKGKEADQCDQIGRLFAYILGTLGTFYSNIYSQCFWLLCSAIKVMNVLFLTKKGWVEFWAIFSQTRRVALMDSRH
jgi:hypothetical protein